MTILKQRTIWMVPALIAGVGAFLAQRSDHPSTQDARITMISAPTSSIARTTGMVPPVEATVAGSTTSISALPAPQAATSGQGEDYRQPVNEQNRDARWAAPTERDVGETLREIPYLGGGGTVIVDCGENICEARGQTDKDASAENRKLAVRYLEGMDFASHLGNVNALADDVMIDQGSGAFTIRFSRVHR